MYGDLDELTGGEGVGAAVANGGASKACCEVESHTGRIFQREVLASSRQS